MSDERVTIEAATRVIRAALAIVSEEQGRVAALEAEISGPGSRNFLQLRRQNDRLQAKIDTLLALCDEQDEICDELRIPRSDGTIDVTAIREILAP